MLNYILHHTIVASIGSVSIASSPKSTLKDNYRLVMASLLSFICTCVYHIRAGVLPWLLVHIVSYAVVVLLLSYTGQDNISVCNFTVD